MRIALLCLLLLHGAVRAQDAKRLQRALHASKVNALDRWMKHEIHRTRKGYPVNTVGSTSIRFTPTYEFLVEFLIRQPGVVDAAWDKCMAKEAKWPGHSTVGLRWRKGDQVVERCWTLQEGIPGTLNFPGWRPHVRKDRQQLKYLGARECPGFVEEQHERCASSMP